MEKSNYGPKGAKLYNIADNARRKASNTTTIEGAGPNSNVKDYGGHGGAKIANIEDARIKRANRKQPVKVLSDQEKASWAASHPERLKIAKSGQWSLEKSWSGNGTPRSTSAIAGTYRYIDNRENLPRKDKDQQKIREFSPQEEQQPHVGPTEEAALNRKKPERIASASSTTMDKKPNWKHVGNNNVGIATNGQWHMKKEESNTQVPHKNQFEHGPTIVDVTPGKKHKDANPRKWTPEGKAAAYMKDPSSYKLHENGRTFS